MYKSIEEMVSAFKGKFIELIDTGGCEFLSILGYTLMIMVMSLLCDRASATIQSF
jgi:hypothetical protein